MLCVPALTEVAGLTIYGDDTSFWLFYPIPVAPRIREHEGEPVLLLISYAVSDEERAAHPELPAGGGYLSLDTVIAANDEQLAEAATHLQPDVDRRWEQLRNGSSEDQQKVAGMAEPPRVAFGTPTFTEGAVTLDAPQNAALVSARMAAGTPTLLAGNVASFNLDLTADGAQFIARSLTAGTGALAPLQVAYDLSFWARLPAARIHMAIDASKMHEYVRKQLVGRGVDQCTTYDYDHNEVTQESLTLSGAVTVQIDTGSGSLPDQVVAELRAYAFDTLKELVRSTFFQPAPTPTPAQPTPAAPRPAGYRDPTLQIKDFDSQKMNVTLDLEQSSVVAWRIHPRATLTGVVGADAAARDRHIRTLPLDDPFFRNVNSEVEVFTDFTEVDHVEVALSYEGVDGEGKPRTSGTVLTFNGPGAQHWSVARFGGPAAYRARHRVVYPGGIAGEWSRWETTSSPRLPVSVPSPGIIRAQALAGRIDFDTLVASVQVTVAYGDLANGVPEERGVLVLTKDHPTQEYRRRIGVPIGRPVRYRVRFDLISGEVIDSDEWVELVGEQFVVNQPSESVLRVTLLPTGNAWADVVAAFVTLEYRDAEGRVSSETLVLRGMDEFRTWQVYLRDRTRRAYRYRWTASFKDGSTATRDWTENPGDPVLSVPLVRTGLDILVVPDAIDFALSPLVEVTLTAASPSATKTMVFTSKTPQVWTLEGAKAEDLRIGVDVTHFPPGRDPVRLPPRTETDPVIVLPAVARPAAPIQRIVVFGSLVDYDASPLVGVDIQAGPDHASVESVTLSRDMPFVDVVLDPDRLFSSYRYRITYFDKTGSPTEGPWQDATGARIVVPAA